MPLRVKIIDENPQTIVTLAQAKEWLAVDYDDFNTLIQSLIDSSIKRSQAVSGNLYWPVKVEVKGNSIDEFVYPWYPIISDPVPVEEDKFDAYSYEAGFEVGEFPDDLKRAVLQRVATGFAERQNGLEVALSKATNPSLMIELAYRQNLYV